MFYGTLQTSINNILHPNNINALFRSISKWLTSAPAWHPRRAQANSNCRKTLHYSVRKLNGTSRLIAWSRGTNQAFLFDNLRLSSHKASGSSWLMLREHSPLWQPFSKMFYKNADTRNDKRYVKYSAQFQRLTGIFEHPLRIWDFIKSHARCKGDKNL